MKKSVIFLTLLLIASIAGTYAVYEFYVKDKMKLLGEHMEQAKRLESRISGLETTFSKTEPQAVVDAWRQGTQPWAEAVENRSRFFTLGTLVEPVKIPEEVIPKIYYRDELPKRIKALEDYARDKQVLIGDSGCGVPKATSFGEGFNPKRDEIAVHLETFDYCAALTRIAIDAGPISVAPLKIWSESEVDAKSGSIKSRTVGMSMQLTSEKLVKFLDRLAQSERYFKVDEIKVSNTDLHNPTPILSVEMLMTQAYFVPSKQSAAGTPGASSDVTDARLSSLFGNRVAKNKDQDTKTPTWWQRFRKSYLPF